MPKLTLCRLLGHAWGDWWREPTHAPLVGQHIFFLTRHCEWCGEEEQVQGYTQGDFGLY